MTNEDRDKRVEELMVVVYKLSREVQQKQNTINQVNNEIGRLEAMELQTITHTASSNGVPHEDPIQAD